MLADGVSDENPHQAWYWNHSSLCLNLYFFSLRHSFFAQISYICTSPDTFWRWKPRTWAHEIDAAFSYSRFSIKPWWNSFFQRRTGITSGLQSWICGAQRKNEKGLFCCRNFFLLLLFTLVMLIRVFFFLFIFYRPRNTTIKMTNN